MSSPWTEGMVSLLRTMWAQGHSFAKIARVISLTHGVQISRSAALGKASRVGLRRTGPQDAASRKERSVQSAKAGVRARRMTGSLPPVKERAVQVRELGPRPNAVPFLERERFQCSFPVSGSGDSMLVCGERATRGPYCASCWEYTHKPKGEAA